MIASCVTALCGSMFAGLAERSYATVTVFSLEPQAVQVQNTIAAQSSSAIRFTDKPPLFFRPFVFMIPFGQSSINEYFVKVLNMHAKSWNPAKKSPADQQTIFHAWRGSLFQHQPLSRFISAVFPSPRYCATKIVILETAERSMTLPIS